MQTKKLIDIRLSRKELGQIIYQLRRAQGAGVEFAFTEEVRERLDKADREGKALIAMLEQIRRDTAPEEAV